MERHLGVAPELALGVAVGSGAWLVVLSATLGGGGDSPDELAQALAVWPYMLLATAGTVVAIGLAACLAPTLKGVRIPPLEALRVDA